MLGKTTPRLATRPLVEGPPGPCGCGCALTSETTYGFAVEEFARSVVSQPLDPWQRWLVIHGMEVLSNGWPRFRQVVVLVARQNGKTELLVVLSLFWLWVQQVGMVLGTSTKLDYSREAWSKSVTLARRSRELCGDISARGSVRNANGEQEMRTPWGSRYKIAAANEEGGRSLTINRLIEDELRQHHDWTAHTAAANAMNAVADAQAWAITNEGDDRAVVLHSFYDAALTYISTGKGDRRLGLFAWSAPAGCDLLDVEATAQANPNLGRRVHWESLEGEAIRAQQAGGEVEAKYRTEVLCQRVADLKPRPILVEDWAATAVDVHPSGPPVFFVTVSKEMDSATVMVAALEGGVPHVGIAAHQPGTDWVTARVRDLRSKHPQARFGAYQAGPVKAWVPTLAESGVVLDLLPAGEAAAACTHLQKLAAVRGFTHSPHEILVDSLKGAEKRDVDGGGWVWDWRKSTGDLAPLAGATGALWLLEKKPTYDVLASVY